MAKSSTKKRASKANKSTVARATDALKHKLGIHDTHRSGSTLLTTINTKCDRSASMSEATTPSPTSTGSTAASENGVNLSASDVDNASCESFDDLSKSNSDAISSTDSKRKANKKKNQKRREAKKNTHHSDQEPTSDIMEAARSESTVEEIAHQPQDDQDTDIDSLTVPTILDSKPDQPSPFSGTRILSLSETPSPIGVAITKTDPYSTRDHDIWASVKDCDRNPDGISSISAPNTDFTDAFLSSNFNVELGSISEWETDHTGGGGVLKGPQDGELEQKHHLSQQHVIPGVQPRVQRQEKWLLNEGETFPPLNSKADIETVIETQKDLYSDKPSGHDTNAVVATSAIQCLTKAKDMELSYVAILSAINTLTTHNDSTDIKGDAARMNARARHVEKLYSILLRIMTQKTVADRLGQETVRQGDLTPEALYLQLYSGILANYRLQIKDHVLLGQYLLDRQKFDDALSCLSNIDRPQWTAAVFRTGINCHLLSKPRQIHEADVLLEQYLALNTIKQAPGTRSDSGINYASLEQTRLRHSSIRKWFKVQLDASKWEEVKELYEQRRARLTVAFGQVGCSNSTSDSTETKLSQVMGYSSTRIQFVKDPVAAQQASDRFDTAKTKPRSFSFLSSLKLSSSSGTGSNMAATQNATSGTSGSTVSAQLQYRQLTTLDNLMLEECVSYKKYEYGWKQVYERMGTSLEDKDTARLAMRLCKRAFLSHAENNEHDGQSPLKVLSDSYVESELDQHDLDPADYGLHHVMLTEEVTEHCRQEDPDIWEARAWAIYNKAMMSPFTFHNGASPSPSPTGAHPSYQSHTSRSMTTTTGGASTMSPLSAMSGTKSLTMFLHNILKVSINSTDRSSRYQKAFRIYGMMRSDPFNQYQAQLRDPFVVTCVIKAVYDEVMATARRSEDVPEADPEAASIFLAPPVQQPSMSLSSIISRSNSSPPLGLLFDMAFEIYADMRNLGPIRHLPQLVALAPQTPMAKTPVAHQASSSFFSRSSSTSTVAASTTRTVDLDTQIMTLQELNPTLAPNPQARRLPSELYLALLHLCIQVPDKTLSLLVVKTIVADMMTSVGQQACDLDRHLAAALQMYHDRCMCLPVPVVPKRRFEKDPVEEEAPSAPDTGCIFREWMYRSEEYIQEHATSSSSSSSSASTSTNDLHAGLSRSESSLDQEVTEIVSPTGRVLDPDAVEAIHAILGDNGQPPSWSSTSSSLPKSSEPDLELADKVDEDEERESSHYGISKHDADLDELDQYLGDARNQGTCNDRFYWDLIKSDTDPELSKLLFSRKRARMLWRHVGRI
ncbi:hypothetical protein BGZ82_004131 [Podila clonocystis]|nr:hypothetical protein BGZ82_004131 [Podila clonocystis]